MKGVRQLKAVVTGAKGFIGKNLVIALRRAGVEVAEVDLDSHADDLASAVRHADVVYHLAGVNRPEHEEEFMAGNVGSLNALFEAIKAEGSRPCIVLSSSTQAMQDNPYGRSKLIAEQALEEFSSQSGCPAMIYRMPGVFGKWCRPNYNSVVATFCHNIARDLPISIRDPAHPIELVHVDDVVTRFMQHLKDPLDGLGHGEVAPVFNVTLGELAERLQSFKASRMTLEVADASDSFTRRLFGTYMSYIPPQDLPYPLVKHADPRGTLAELLKSPHFGQLFISRTHPGITRGNHYHDLKVEKFCVLEGDAVIRFRPIAGDGITEHRISGIEFQVVDIPPGYTHSIENIGTTEMIVLFWASEILDRERPDTYPSEVVRG